MSVQDSDISTPVNPPNIGSQDDSARSLQVNLSHLLSVILTSKYNLMLIWVALMGHSIVQTRENTPRPIPRTNESYSPYPGPSCAGD